jgi:tetratricopeptide (TPR) repeat protein
MGQLYLAMGEKDKAKDYFEKAHERKPSQVDTLYFLASLAIEKGEKDKAKEYLEKAVGGNYSALCTTTREQAQQLMDSLKSC